MAEALSPAVCLRCAQVVPHRRRGAMAAVVAEPHACPHGVPCVVSRRPGCLVECPICDQAAMARLRRAPGKTQVRRPGRTAGAKGQPEPIEESWL